MQIRAGTKSARSNFLLLLDTAESCQDLRFQRDISTGCVGYGGLAACSIVTKCSRTTLLAWPVLQYAKIRIERWRADANLIF